jgi:hypothetical protein
MQLLWSSGVRLGSWRDLPQWLRSDLQCELQRPQWLVRRFHPHTNIHPNTYGDTDPDSHSHTDDHPDADVHPHAHADIPSHANPDSHLGADEHIDVYGNADGYCSVNTNGYADVSRDRDANTDCHRDPGDTFGDADGHQYAATVPDVGAELPGDRAEWFGHGTNTERRRRLRRQLAMHPID